MDHMSSILNLFVSYIPCPINIKFQTTDETSLKMATKGKINLDLIDIFEDVVNILNLCVNLFLD